MSDEKEVEELAKELYEVCCYPEPMPFKNIFQNEKDVWNYKASVILNKYVRKQSTQDMKSYKKLEIWKDDDCEGFAAFCVGSSQDKPMIVLNVGSTLLACLENKINPKEIIIENLMHEFGHFLEELMEKEFDEEMVERIVQSYRDKYGSK